MRLRMLALTTYAFSGFSLSAAAGDAAKQPKHLEHPGEVALIEESGGYAYRHFPSGLWLYTYDRDRGGKSSCVKECSFAWPPVTAREGAKPMGDWTLVARDDGKQQWAYKGRPIYLRYHDTPETPQGDKAEGVWHVLKP